MVPLQMVVGQGFRSRHAKAMPIFAIYHVLLNGLRYWLGEPCVGKRQFMDICTFWPTTSCRAASPPTGGARLICAPGPFVRPIRRTRLAP